MGLCATKETTYSIYSILWSKYSRWFQTSFVGWTNTIHTALLEEFSFFSTICLDKKYSFYFIQELNTINLILIKYFIKTYVYFTLQFLFYSLNCLI